MRNVDWEHPNNQITTLQDNSICVWFGCENIAYGVMRSTNIQPQGQLTQIDFPRGLEYTYHGILLIRI